MPYLAIVLSLCLLTACKTVDVLIPAQYPLAQEKAVVIHPFSGQHGAQISQNILSHLHQKLPSLSFYTQTPNNHTGVVHLYGQVNSFHIGKPQIHWGDYDAEQHYQYGEVSRDIHIHIAVRIENAQHQVLWAQSFEHDDEQNTSFSISSDEAYQSLDAGTDILQGKILQGILDSVTQDDMEQEALASLPSVAEARTAILQAISIEIAQGFYDRTEQHLEFR